MKKFLLLVVLIFLPLPIHAAEISDCTSTPECICSPVLDFDLSTGESISQVTIPVSAASSVEACNDICWKEKAINYPSITQWSIQCTTASGLESLGAGNLDFVDEAVQQYYADPALSVPIPNLEFTSAYESGGVVVVNYLGEYIEAMYQWSISAGAILAIIMIMVGGVQYALARGKPSGIEKAKERIGNAVTGMLLLLFAWLIAFTVDPATTQFDALRVQFVEKIEFISNETPFDFVEQDWQVDGTPGNNAVGHNGVKMWDQKAYANDPYGPDSCKTETSGNIKSSGCGVTSFAMAVTFLSGKSIDPPTVADSFWRESEETEKNFRPICDDGCGCNGTHYNAFVESELLGQTGTRGRHIGTDKQAEIIALAEQGKLIIYLYRTSSGGGHYVLITGLDENGNFQINNPWGGRMETRTPSQVFAVAKAFTYIDSVTDFIEAE